MKVLVTGSSGLIGSEAVRFFDSLGFSVVGLDNNMRARFFGPRGDTTAVRQQLETTCRRFEHMPLDIRDRAGVEEVCRRNRFDLVIHAAAQPSHDLAAQLPFDDFEINAVGTLNLLEGCRRQCPEAVFVQVSTNKVYGDGPNRLPLKELDMRWDFDDPQYRHGISENFPVDQSLHSLFGVSKLAADLMAQEYGRYFGMKTGIFRGGCLTGPQHAGVELHGFLNYLVSVSLMEGEYTVYGYRGKQVRDQIHSWDVVNAFWHFAQKPRCGEVYNLGGGKPNAASILECIELIATKARARPRLRYVDQHRIGDHVCYYSDTRKFQQHYPGWTVRHSLDGIVEEMVHAMRPIVK